MGQFIHVKKRQDDKMLSNMSIAGIKTAILKNIF